MVKRRALVSDGVRVDSCKEAKDKQLLQGLAA